MRILCVLISVVALVQCAEPISLLEEIKSLDLMQLIEQSLTNLTDYDNVTQIRLTNDHESLRGQSYDWKKCVNDLEAIVAGIRKADRWAMQSKYLEYFFVFCLEFNVF